MQQVESQFMAIKWTMAEWLHVLINNRTSSPDPGSPRHKPESQSESWQTGDKTWPGCGRLAGRQDIWSGQQGWEFLGLWIFEFGVPNTIIMILISIVLPLLSWGRGWGRWSRTLQDLWPGLGFNFGQVSNYWDRHLPTLNFPSNTLLFSFKNIFNILFW